VHASHTFKVSASRRYSLCKEYSWMRRCLGTLQATWQRTAASISQSINQNTFL